MKRKSEDDLPPLAERRPRARKRVLLGGMAVHQLRRGGVACQVRDISETGARITVSPATEIPEQLHLIIVREGVAYEARMVWRRGGEIGLAFSRTIDLKSPDPSQAHLVQVWAQQRTDHLSWR